MNWLISSLRENPELAIFLTLALGFVIGRIRFGTFTLGNVVGTLLAGVLVGQLDIKVDPLVKVVFFDLFLFATGYKVGPQFFRGLKKNALSQALLTVVLCVASLATTVGFARLMGYDAGHRGRTHGRRFHRVHGHRHRGQHDLPPRPPRGGEGTAAEQHPGGVCGQLSGGHRVRRVVPLRPGPAAAADRPQGREPEARGGGGHRRARPRPGSAPPTANGTCAPSGSRAPLRALKVAEVEGSFAPARVFVQRIRRGPEVLEARPEEILRPGDSWSSGRAATSSWLRAPPSARRSRIGRSSTSPWPPSTWS